MTFSAPPGVYDIIPKDLKDPWKSSYIWNYVEHQIRAISLDYGFQEMRTPIFEKTELLKRGIGEGTDIVTKEMYTFDDKGGRSMTLRPEGTAPALRAFLENNLPQQGSLHRLFYIAPMFRYERTQAGRFRQHHQFGVEAIGSEAPEVDAEVIDLAFSLYTRLGLKNLTVAVNSIGDLSARNRYREALKKYLSSRISELSSESQTRFEKNPLRILDSKDPKDQEIIQDVPSILDFLDEDSAKHFEQVKKCLTALNIPFQVNPKLVRGLDYYNRTVFEVISSSLGSQNSICGGGRYDGLIKELGGPDLPACGFGSGIERILQTMVLSEVSLPKPPHAMLYLIPLGEKAKETCFRLQKDLRSSDIPVQMDYSGRKLNKLMSYVDQIGATYVAVIGDEELNTNTIQLKEMSSGNITKVRLEDVKRILQVENNAENFLSLWQEMNTPFKTSEEANFFLQKISKSIDDTSKITDTLQNALKQMKDVLEQK